MICSEAKIYGSQGQQRTSALSMKIAQADYIHHIKSEYPILLLDDIMSELDINRRMYLSQKIRDKQVLITSTDTDLIESTDNTKLFKIKNGSGGKLMYLRVEENIVVNTKDIIGIFDMDNTTVSRLGRNFLAESQKNGLIINSTDDLPKSFVVVKEKDETKVFISSVSSKVLAKRGL